MTGNFAALARARARRLDDGSTHEVLKNFPRPESMARRLGAHGSSLDWQELEYYWVVSYRIARQAIAPV